MKINVGLIQMRCSSDPAENTRRAAEKIAEAAAAGAQDHLPARDVPHALLLPARGRGVVRPGRTGPRPVAQGLHRGGEKARAW
jgi:hypothetical protein